MTTEQLTSLLNADSGAVMERDFLCYREQIVKAADLIAAHAEQRPVILLAGPSGSGKTTTALLIEQELERRGYATHTLQMDNYFCPLSAEEIALLRQNKLDLEKPTRVDIPYFQTHLDQILAGEEIELPRYDFKTSSRVFDGHTLRRKEGELVIIEGIHALNPEVSGHLEHTTRVYVSVRTRVTGQSGLVLHPSKIRLLRRLLRDRTGRGRALHETIGMCKKVDAGEKKYIMPYKPYAHCDIDSFYATELSIYRPYIMEDLETLLPEHPDLEDVVEILRELPDLHSEAVPHDSLLREFIGGSSLAY